MQGSISYILYDRRHNTCIVEKKKTTNIYDNENDSSIYCTKALDLAWFGVFGVWWGRA